MGEPAFAKVNELLQLAEAEERLYRRSSQELADLVADGERILGAFVGSIAGGSGKLAGSTVTGAWTDERLVALIDAGPLKRTRVWECRREEVHAVRPLDDSGMVITTIGGDELALEGLLGHFDEPYREAGVLESSLAVVRDRRDPK